MNKEKLKPAKRNTEKQELEEFKLEIKQAKQQAEKQKLRQHYAGLAMQGLLVSDTNCRFSYMTVAEIAVNQADALIEQLNKESKE